MNKKSLSIIVTILLISVISISCSGEDLNPDEGNSGITTKRIENIIHEKLEHDIDIDKDIDAVDLDGDGNLEYIVKYKTQEKDKPLRIMILSKKDDKLVSIDEIKNVGEDFDTINYIDINNNGTKEIVAGFKAGENLSKGISIYAFSNGKTTEIFEEYYSDYIVKDVDKDGKRDVVLIKEKEKQDKSYAYLYIYREDEFKKVKKVEIEPTLDTKDEIVKKLLEN